MLFAVVSVLLLVLITRELGGGRAAQTLCAWGYAFATSTLLFGHVMLTSSFDLVVWPLVSLLIVRAVLRAEPRWWILAGVVVGLSMYNKLLVAMLLAAFGCGLALVGPRRLLWSRWVIGSALIALLIGAPNLWYQATHHWPELAMGDALRDNNAADVRVGMWPFLFVLLGPPLTPVWVSGLVALWRRQSWRAVRFIAAAFPVLLVFVFVAGTQLYYPVGLLSVLFAAGCVPTVHFVARSKPWTYLLCAGVLGNAVVSSLVALPVIPVADLGSTPIPAINQTAGDAVGWPRYVEQVARVYRGLTRHAATTAVVIASNYGEAGAIDRYGAALGLPAVFSDQNQLHFQARPPAGTRVVVFVGGQLGTARSQFRSCRVQARLDNGVNVDNEEEGQPVAVCRGPRHPWPTIWSTLRHYD